MKPMCDTCDYFMCVMDEQSFMVCEESGCMCSIELGVISGGRAVNLHVKSKYLYKKIEVIV